MYNIRKQLKLILYLIKFPLLPKSRLRVFKCIFHYLFGAIKIEKKRGENFFVCFLFTL